MNNYDVENRNESCYNEHVGETTEQRLERLERMNGL